jgi:hypothetical protein
MKGISLPFNILVIVILVVIVLISLVVLILYYWKQTPTYDVLYHIGCLSLIRDCNQNINMITVESGGKTYTLSEICQQMGMDTNACKKNCGC